MDSLGPCVGFQDFCEFWKKRRCEKSWCVFVFQNFFLREIPKDDGARLFFGGFQRSGFQHDLFFDLWGYWWSCMARLSEEGQFFFFVMMGNLHIFKHVQSRCCWDL